MTEHAVVIAGGGPTGLMLAASWRWRASTSPSSSGAPTGARRLARGRPARAHHRGARSARHRRAIPLAGTGAQVAGFAMHPAGHQRLSHPPQLRARALAEPHRAHPGRLGRRAGGADLSRARGDGLRAGRHRRRRRARPTAVAARASISSGATADAASSARPPASNSPGGIRRRAG